jgi:hypothetical protein
LFVKFSTLKEYGIDRVFFLENDNVDSSQRNVIFLARGEKAKQAIAIAGEFLIYHSDLVDLFTNLFSFHFFHVKIAMNGRSK